MSDSQTRPLGPQPEPDADQIDRLNRVFHDLWHVVMFARRDSSSEKIQRLSFREMHALAMAYERPDLILREIRERLAVPQTTLSSIVSKLEKSGYVRRAITPRDMRSFSLEITEKGRDMKEDHDRRDAALARGALQAIPEPERDRFLELFAHMVQGLGRNTSQD